MCARVCTCNMYICESLCVSLLTGGGVVVATCVCRRVVMELLAIVVVVGELLRVEW